VLTPLLKPDDVAALLAISKKAVDSLCRSGKLSYIRVNGKERRFTEEQVREYIEAQTMPSRATGVDRRRSKPLRSPKGKRSIEGGADLGKELRELCL
jgi:excisionase family DNA binding protein